MLSRSDLYKYSLFISTLCISILGQGNLVILDSKTLNGDNIDARIEEIRRDDSISVVQIKRSKGPSVEESMFVIRTLCVIAKTRQVRYFVIIKEGKDENGVYTYEVGFLDRRVNNLKGYFGITEDRLVKDEEIVDSKEIMEMFGW